MPEPPKFSPEIVERLFADIERSLDTAAKHEAAASDARVVAMMSAVLLRRQGVTWREIGERLGVSAQAAYQRLTQSGRESNRRNQARRRKERASDIDAS